MSESVFRAMIRELIEQELEEVSSTGTAGGEYSTPHAFRGNTAAGKAKTKRVATTSGYEIVPGKDEIVADPLKGDDKK